MRKFRNPVLVLGGGLSSLWIARTLGSRGIGVYIVLDGNSPYILNEAIFSRYCKKSFVAYGVKYDRKVLRDLLRRVAKCESERLVVYPCTDLDALNLSELKDEMCDDYHFIAGDKEAVEILVNKRKFYKALDLNEITYPVTYFPEDLEDARQVGANLSFPVFVRPAITQLFSQVFGVERKGFIAYSPKELIDYYQSAAKHGIEMMFQEIIPGPPSNSFQLEGYYNLRHDPTVLFARQRLRIWPLNFGNTTLCVSISLARLANEKKIVNEFIKTICYNGLMSAEFKEDPRDGKLKFLEINARAWLHFWLSGRCGADIIFSSYLDSIGEKTEYIEEYETDVKSLIFTNDFKASAKMFADGNHSILEWISSLRGKIHPALFQKTDLSPFTMVYARSLLKRLYISEG